jgi:hypothetical protein
MKRSLFLALTISAVLSSSERSDAQNYVRRPNGYNIYRSQYQPYDITRFSARPVYPTRFHANPVYPNTMFWSNAYPNSPNILNAIEAYNAANMANMQNGQYGPAPAQGTFSGPAYYPWSDVPLTQGQLGPSR